MSAKKNAPGYDAQRQKAQDRPIHPPIGTVITEHRQKLVHTGRDMWAWYPSTAYELECFAKAKGWGTKVEITGAHEFVGFNDDGDRMYRTYAKIVLIVGRESGPTKNGRTSKGYAYRLMWDTSRTGLFELESWYRKTTTHPNWVGFGSVGEIRAIIALHPVITLNGEKINDGCQ
jgi:hypothetical protein